MSLLFIQIFVKFGDASLTWKTGVAPFASSPYYIPWVWPDLDTDAAWLIGHLTRPGFHHANSICITCWWMTCECDRRDTLIWCLTQWRIQGEVCGGSNPHDSMSKSWKAFSFNGLCPLTPNERVLLQDAARGTCFHCVSFKWRSTSHIIYTQMTFYCRLMLP